MEARVTVPVVSKAISSYVTCVFGHLDGLVPVRLLPEKGAAGGSPNLPFVSVADVAARLAALAPAAAEQGRGVFVVPGTVALAGKARTQDIVQSGVLLIDLDEVDVDTASAAAERVLGPASLIVASGGVTASGQRKRHLYWRLTEPAEGEDLARLADLRARVARRLEGDPAFASLHQPIRVAGTVHAKQGKQSPVEIIGSSPREYELADLEEAAQNLPQIGRQQPDAGAGKQRLGPKQLATTPIHEGARDAATRFEALSSVIGHWVRQVRLGICTPDEAWSAVQDHNQAMIMPPWPEDRLVREYAALQRLDARNNGASAAVSGGDGSGATVATPYSEDALAEEFVTAVGDQWRHTALWGSWHRWTGRRWQEDCTGAIQEAVRQVCRSAAVTCEKPADAKRLSSERSFRAVRAIVATDPQIATETSAWDAHPMLLNTPDGIIDLETGECRSPDPALMLTQATSVAPGGQCPRWKTFLDEITGGDAYLQAYLARLAGYCLTGSTSEQVFAFLHGSGANGKSVFLSTLGHVLGDYAATATLDCFMDSSGTRHLSELAGLRAARLVVVPETESDRAWAEARIKTVTGGETIRANFMRQDHFEYRPGFKLLFAGNHRPALKNVGAAIRRRLHLVPFDVTIPAAARDPGLSERLKAEASGILAWAIEGCADWQRQGLKPPERVRAASEAYINEEDSIGLWIEDCCALDVNARATSFELFDSWRNWAQARGQATGTQRSLGQALGERGLTQGKVGGNRGWLGIALKQPAPDDGVSS